MVRTDSRQIETAATRAAAYTLLAHCLAEPAASGAIALQEAAQAAAPFLQGTALAGLARVAAASAPAELAREYAGVFGLGPSLDCPTFESGHFQGETMGQMARMADIAGFYRAFGVEAAGAGLRPDEVCVELEFMAFMCRKEIHALESKGTPRAAQVRRAERLFLADHLGRWAPVLARSIVDRACPGSLLSVAGAALARWVDEDCALLGAEPDPPAEAGDSLAGAAGSRTAGLIAPTEIPVV
jgi:TorA maturation chaperone TorD